MVKKIRWNGRLCRETKCVGKEHAQMMSSPIQPSYPHGKIVNPGHYEKKKKKERDFQCFPLVQRVWEEMVKCGEWSKGVETPTSNSLTLVGDSQNKLLLNVCSVSALFHFR